MSVDCSPPAGNPALLLDEAARYERELETRRKSKQAGTDGPPAAGNPVEPVVPSAAEVSGSGGSVATARKASGGCTDAGNGVQGAQMATTIAVPCMAVRPCGSQPHRDRIPEVSIPSVVAVSRKVKRAEVERVPAAKAAVDAEWKKLAEMPHPDGKGVGVWDIASVRESSDVRREAQRKGITIHFGMVAELCFEKNVDQVVGAEPGKEPKSSPAVYKGRHVFLGDSVKDQNFDWAEFEALGSSPPSLEAAKALDVVSLLPGMQLSQSDAHSAYTQTFLGGARGGGTPTWVAIPRHRWPKSWEGKVSETCC